MHFVNFDICLDGKWESKSCDKGSLFWVVTNCCIPIEKYPSLDECLLMEEERNQNKTIKDPEVEQRANHQETQIEPKESKKDKEKDSDIDQDNLSTIEEELPESEEGNESFSAGNDLVAGYRGKENKGSNKYLNQGSN